MKAKFTIAERVQAEMIEGDLRQAWSSLDARLYELAVMHLQDAIDKIEQMRVADKPPTSKQLTIDV